MFIEAEALGAKHIYNMGAVAPPKLSPSLAAETAPYLTKKAMATK